MTALLPRKQAGVNAAAVESRGFSGMKRASYFLTGFFPWWYEFVTELMHVHRLAGLSPGPRRGNRLTDDG
jgi:hypothetical protein